ncbi:cadherin-related family member 5 isoform X2 [Saimiri boliviensis]|uniref:cadherin-related family member 5 isoform X2 n=1 Tax=Saimiri boliviensis TaxID=27679 RepID=UPI00193CD649|nr:cadherin-related family member 5 isoform X2 [Saimiri boliviensis boliviensis]
MPEPLGPSRRVTAAKMGAWALLWPPLLLAGLLGQPPGALAQAQYCSVNKTYFEVEENTSVTEPLVDIHVPAGLEVTLGPSSTPFAFRILRNQLFLNVTPDYEENSLLQAELRCERGGSLVTQTRVIVSVLDINDNSPEFSFTTKEISVEEDTKVSSTVIPETELEAKDPDVNDILFYTLQEETTGASDYFSLVGANRPALRLDRPLDFDKRPKMAFRLLVRDTPEEDVEPSHTATATLVLNVMPADLRPPWFLPCSFSDGYVCIQAQYLGAVPTGHILPSPLVLRPGPIYAEDGDRGINQRIIYSIQDGNVNGTFIIHPDSGNLTMARSVPSPMTFLLLVKGQQADLTRYSVTQVTVRAVAAAGSPPHFPQSLYRGTVALGSGAGVAVKDKAAPTQPLRIQAQDPEFPDLNSAITYRITNHSHFRMEGEVVLTATTLLQAGTFYAEVEANNTVTLGTTTTVIEIQVSEQEPPPTAQTPEPGTSQPMPPGVGTSTSHQPANPTPGGGTAQTPELGTSQSMPPGVGTSTSHQPANPTPGGGTAQTSEPGTSQPMTPGVSRSTAPSGMPGGRPSEDRRFSAVDMATLGGVLGALLLLAVLGLAILVHKHYGPRLKCCSGKAPEPEPLGSDNPAFQPDHKTNWAPAPGPTHDPKPSETPPVLTEPTTPSLTSPGPEAPGPSPPGSGPESPAAAHSGESPAAVRSILTKERRPEGGYKAVWFGEDIGAEADVVVLNAPTPDVDGAGDSSGDEDEGGWGRGPHDAPGNDSTYI